jgi:hypothetical protein
MILLTFFIIVVFSYVVLYLGGRKYLEKFEAKGQVRGPRTASSESMPVVSPPERPYATSPIDSVDDYEYSVVFQNEGSREVSDQHINDAMARYPLDWSTQGPNSQHFQENQQEYKKTMKPQLTRALLEEGFDATLPDSLQQDEEEKKILQTYQPKCTKSLTEYCVDDVKAIAERVYEKKGMIPVIEKSKQGTNIWEIVELKEKDPKIVWEDDPVQPDALKQERGEDVIEVPQMVSDVTAGLDPFFQQRNPYRKQKNDYGEWTPGLERMFAPTHPVKSWF